MDPIIANLTNPSWWFTGFFLVVPWPLSYAFRALKPGIAKSIPLTLLLALPISFFEIRWLNSDSLAKDAIKSREKIAKLRDGTAPLLRRS